MANLHSDKTLEGSVFQRVFWSLAAFHFLLISAVSYDYGITWDEWMDANNGLLTLRHILSFWQDKAYLDFWHGYLYSGFFHTVVGTFYGLFTGTFGSIAFGALHDDAHLLGFFFTSHWLNAVCGFIAVLAAGLTAQRIAGWRAGALTLVLMILSPRFFGASFNDPKDIPMAAGYMLGLYFLVRFLAEMPAFRRATCAGLAAGIAFAIGARAAGIILLPYLALFTFVVFFTSPPEKRPPLLKLGTVVFFTALAGYLGGLLFWPYGLSNPFVNPLAALAELSKFSYWDGVVLFEGRVLRTQDLPWYYLLKWIWISVPFFIHAGLFLFLFQWKALAARLDWRLTGALAFSVVFPLFYQIVRQSTVLDSWRHFFFIYPPLAVLAALAWDQLWETASSRVSKIVIAAALGTLLFMPLEWMIRNHPHQYLYFNPIAGGVKGALGRYETDYWGNSLRGCAEWLGAYHKSRHPGEPAVVRADGSVMNTYPFLKEALGDLYHPFGYPRDFIHKDPYFYISYGPELRGPGGWDYAVIMTRGWNPELLRTGQWPPEEGLLFKIEADGAPLCAVIAGPERRGKNG